MNKFTIITSNLRCPLHINPEFEIVLSRKGSITVEHENFVQTIEERQASLILPYHLHRFEPSDDVEASVLLFPLSMFEGTYNSLCSKSYSSYKFMLDEIHYSYIDKALDLYLRNRDDFTLKSLFYTFLSAFSIQNEPTGKTNTDSQCVRVLMEYMYANIDRELTLSGVSSATGIGKKQISSIFNDYFNISFTRLVNNMRLEKAKSMLLDTDMSITEVAYECGFGSLRSFNRVFADQLLCTPTQFKSRMNESQK